MGIILVLQSNLHMQVYCVYSLSDPDFSPETEPSAARGVAVLEEQITLPCISIVPQQFLHLLLGKKEIF